eukprot:CFRG3243T1
MTAKRSPLIARRKPLSDVSEGETTSMMTGSSVSDTTSLASEISRPRYGSIRTRNVSYDDDNISLAGISMQFDFSTATGFSSLESHHMETLGRTASIAIEQPLIEENKDDIFRDCLYMLYKYNTPSPTVLAYAEELAKALGITTSILLRPTGFWLCNGLQRTEYVFINRVYNVNKMSQAVKITTNIIKMRKTGAIYDRIKSIETEDSVYPWWAMLAAFPLYGIGFTGFFFGGDLNAALVGMSAGCVLSLMNAMFMHGFFVEWSNLKLIIGCLLASMTCVSMCVLGFVSPPCCFAAMLGSIAVDFPGISIAMASLEMMAGTVVTGATRFAISSFQGEQIALALLAGYEIVVQLTNQSDLMADTFTGQCTGVNNVGYVLLFYPFLYVAAILYYDVPKHHALPLLLVQFPCYLTFLFLSKTVIGNYAATSFACFVMVVLSWMTAAYFDDSGWTTISAFTPTMELLVPGSSVVRSSIFSFLSRPKNATYGSAYIITAITLAVGITAGDAFLQTCRVRAMHNVPLYKGPLNAYNASSFDLDSYLDNLDDDIQDYALVTISQGQVRTHRRFMVYSPFVQIKVNGGHTICRSSTKHETDTPEWDELFLVPLEFDKSTNEAVLSVHMVNFHEYSRNSVLGKVDIKLKKKPTRYGMVSRSLSVFNDVVVDESVEETVAWEGVASMKSDRFQGEIGMSVTWCRRESGVEAYTGSGKYSPSITRRSRNLSFGRQQAGLLGRRYSTTSKVIGAFSGTAAVGGQESSTDVLRAMKAV